MKYSDFLKDTQQQEFIVKIVNNGSLRWPLCWYRCKFVQEGPVMTAIVELRRMSLLDKLRFWWEGRKADANKP